MKNGRKPLKLKMPAKYADMPPSDMEYCAGYISSEDWTFWEKTCYIVAKTWFIGTGSFMIAFGAGGCLFSKSETLCGEIFATACFGGTFYAGLKVTDMGINLTIEEIYSYRSRN